MKTLKDRIRDFEFPSYVHTYPTNRLYAPLDSFPSEQLLLSKDINIYIHIPFCNQKCTFCGYLTTIDRFGKLQDEYVDALTNEIDMYEKQLSDKRIPTIHFGGGTPSLLSIKQFKRILNRLQEASVSLQDAEELSIEATPETIEYDKISAYRDFGVNRVSIGVESLNDNEVQLSNRHNLFNATIRSIEILRKVGIENICCDLIYGLEGQDIESWRRSVQGLLEFAPETIELYALMVKPMTGLSSGKRKIMNNREKYDCYDLARGILIDAGYEQESQVRFVILNKGSHKQQGNIFRGQSLIGFGAGSRSYADNVHFRNEFDRINNKRAIVEYIRKLHHGMLPVSTGVFLNHNEKARQYAIYNLEDLNKKTFRERFGIDFDEVFENTIDELVELNLADNNQNRLSLTEKGIKFRDLISREFFSDAVNQLEGRYWESRKRIKK